MVSTGICCEVLVSFSKFFMSSSSTELLLRICVFIPLRPFNILPCKHPFLKNTPDCIYNGLFLAHPHSIQRLPSSWPLATWKSLIKGHHHLPADDFRQITLSIHVSSSVPWDKKHYLPHRGVRIK